MKSSIASASLESMRQGTLVVERSHVRALRKFFSNSQHTNTVQERDEALRLVENVWPLSDLYSSESANWMYDILFTRKGHRRDTEEANKFGALEQRIVAGDHSYELVGMVYTPVTYDSRAYPGRERYDDVRPVFRARADSGDYFDFYYRPWQSALAGLSPGIVITGAHHA